MIAENIFRAYDIRGLYPDDLHPESAYKIGRGFGTYLVRKLKKDHPTVVVGRDNRLSGSDLQDFFIQGLMISGAHVTNIGLSPSPYVYFANTDGHFDAGCNVTASHNPKDYNGFKLMLSNAHAVFGEEIQKIANLIKAEDFVEAKGKLSYANFMDYYFKRIRHMFIYSRSLKIVVDTGNGIAGMMYPIFLKKLGHEVIELYTELDGSFPNHEPDPIVEENLKDLKVKVVESGADLGIAFDGDGDRLGLVNEKGEFITSDQLLMLLAQDVLKREKGGSVVFTVSNSESLFELIRFWGGNPIMCKVGHSYVEHAMSESKAILGGEQSGHFFLPEDYYAYDDALVAACRVLKIMDDSDKPFSSFFEGFPHLFAEPEMRLTCSDEDKFDVIKKITNHFSSKYECNTLDGVRINFKNGAWSGIRASNTSPCISITMEAKTKEELAKIKDVVMGHISEYNEIKLS